MLTHKGVILVKLLQQYGARTISGQRIMIPSKARALAGWRPHTRLVVSAWHGHQKIRVFAADDLRPGEHVATVYTMDSTGRVTVPLALLRHLGLKDGDVLLVSAYRNNQAGRIELVYEPVRTTAAVVTAR